MSQQPGGGLLGHRHVEAWVAGRLMRYVEPRVEPLVREFLASDTGQAMLSDVLADVVGDLIDPTADVRGGLAERLVIALVARWRDRDDFRAQVLAALGPPRV